MLTKEQIEKIRDRMFDTVKEDNPYKLGGHLSLMATDIPALLDSHAELQEKCEELEEENKRLKFHIEVFESRPGYAKLNTAADVAVIKKEGAAEERVELCREIEKLQAAHDYQTQGDGILSPEDARTVLLLESYQQALRDVRSLIQSRQEKV